MLKKIKQPKTRDLRSSFASFVLAAACLLGSAESVNAMEIRYDRGPMNVDIGTQDTYNQGGLDNIREFRGRMSFGLPMQYITLSDSSGTLATVVAGAGAAAAAEAKAEAENRKQEHPSSTIGYSYIVSDLRGEDSTNVALRVGWGSNTGGTFGGQSIPDATTSAWSLSLGVMVPVPLIENFLDLDLGYSVGWQRFTLTGLPVTNGVDKHTYPGEDTSIPGYRDPSYEEPYRTEPMYRSDTVEEPLLVGLTLYPVSFLSVSAFGAYDPVPALVGLLVGKNGYPRQAFYYGVRTATLLFSHVRLEAGYKFSASNIGANRGLDEALTYGSAALAW